jgi:hypothetical protein
MSTSLCSGTALDGISMQLAQASDMNKDGTQQPGTHLRRHLVRNGHEDPARDGGRRLHAAPRS